TAPPTPRPDRSRSASDPRARAIHRVFNHAAHEPLRERGHPRVAAGDDERYPTRYACEELRRDPRPACAASRRPTSRPRLALGIALAVSRCSSAPPVQTALGPIDPSSDHPRTLADLNP